MQGSIELDCRPGSPRPGDLISAVVKGTVLEGVLLPNNPNSMCMGNWTWKFEITDRDYEEIKPTLAVRISALYTNDLIRYGSW